jgi:DNA modification methylase
LERSPDEYVAKLVDVFREVRRVLRDDGTLFLNLGDSYASTTKGSGGGPSSTRLGHPTDEVTRIAAAARANGRARFEPRRIELSVGCKPKDLIGIPWRVAFALQADGWYLRSDIIWHKPNPMPESCRDRPTKAHEYVFLLAKNARYYFDSDAVREPVSVSTMKDACVGIPKCRDYEDAAFKFGSGTSASRRLATNAVGNKESRNVRTVWTVTPQPYKGAHFATMPPKLVERCILAGAPRGGAVLDPFFGSGTTGLVAEQLGRQWFGCELNSAYCELAIARIGGGR